MGSYVGDDAPLPSERFKKEAAEPLSAEQGDTTDEAVNIKDMELKEEWQDDEFPRPLPEEISEEDLEESSSEMSPVAPNTLELCGRRRMKKRLPAPDLSSVKSGEGLEATPEGSLDINVDELETPSDSELQEGSENGHEFEWEDDLPRARRLDGNLPEKFCTGRVVDIKGQDGRKWRIFLTDEREQKVDLGAIEPYKKVISHGDSFCHRTSGLPPSAAGGVRLGSRDTHRYRGGGESRGRRDPPEKPQIVRSEGWDTQRAPESHGNCPESPRRSLREQAVHGGALGPLLPR